MKKGIAVPYIVAILLAIIVIGLIGYWSFVTGGKFGVTATEQECRGKLTEYCFTWGLTGFANTTDGSIDLNKDGMYEFESDSFDGWVKSKYNLDCSPFKLIEQKKAEEAKKTCRGF